jgi:serine protease
MSVPPQIRNGELIVKMRTAPAAAMTLGTASLSLVRPLALQRVGLYRAAMNEAETWAMLEKVRQRPDVEWAEPNYQMHALKVPNDPQYRFQWHYPLFNLPQAWDVTTGNASTVVAVLDTGTLHSAVDASLTHPDLVGKVIGGYDFISDPMMGGDGDGRDADPFDVGDKPGAQSSYHGTHVAGTIAAATDNGVGVAGVDWNAKLLSVRVLGVGGGSNADIIDGILWSAGIAVNGVPMNPNPAKVINMSLGGTNACDQASQDAIDQATAKGAIIVVAAGNENADVATSSPANCNNVISVGAVGPNGTRAPYSNFGARIDVMAPGGDTSQAFTVGTDSNPAGVLSTSRDDASRMPNFVFENGTSMAAPHIAGLVSLMVGQNPALTTPQVLAALKMAATKLTAEQCVRPSGDECGAGLVDAAKALGVTAPAAPPKPQTAPAKTYAIARFDTGGGNFDMARSKSVPLTLGAATIPFSIPDLDPGNYVVSVWTDLNDDRMIQPGEPIYASKTPSVVTAGQDTGNVVITMTADTP